MMKKLLPLGLVAAVVSAGIVAGTASAARQIVSGSAYRVAANLTPEQVIPAVQVPSVTKGRFEGILASSGVGTTRMIAIGLGGCTIVTPPRKSGLPTRVVCPGGVSVTVPKSPGVHWRLGWRLTVSSLSGPATGARIHIAAKGAAAPAAFALCSPCSAASRGSDSMTTDQAMALLRGNAYVDVTTAAHPDGEIRGQIFRYPNGPRPVRRVG